MKGSFTREGLNSIRSRSTFRTNFHKAYLHPDLITQSFIVYTLSLYVLVLDNVSLNG